MTHRVKIGIAAAAFAVAGSAASAQSSDWSYAATIYLFMPETDTGIVTPTRELSSTLSFSDALDNLDFAFMGAFEAHNGRWGVIVDYILQDLGFSGPSPVPAYAGSSADVRSQLLTGYLSYRLADNGGLSVDGLAGFRWVEASSSIALTGGPSPAPSASAERSWTDPVIGLRARYEFSDKWFGVVLADYGGFSSGSETWQVALTAGYRISDAWSVQGGYRVIEAENEADGVSLSLRQSGPVIGATYRF